MCIWYAEVLKRFDCKQFLFIKDIQRVLFDSSFFSSSLTQQYLSVKTNNLKIFGIDHKHSIFGMVHNNVTLIIATESAL